MDGDRWRELLDRRPARGKRSHAWLRKKIDAVNRVPELCPKGVRDVRGLIAGVEKGLHPRSLDRRVRSPGRQCRWIRRPVCLIWRRGIFGKGRVDGGRETDHETGHDNNWNPPSLTS